MRQLASSRWSGGLQDGVAHVREMRTQLVAARAVAETLADAAEEPEAGNGRITEVAGPRAERLADAAAALFASRGDSFEIREDRQCWCLRPTTPTPGGMRQLCASARQKQPVPSGSQRAISLMPMQDFALRSHVTEIHEIPVLERMGYA